MSPSTSEDEALLIKLTHHLVILAHYSGKTIAATAPGPFQSSNGAFYVFEYDTKQKTWVDLQGPIVAQPSHVNFVYQSNLAMSMVSSKS